jgi:hypothetical protein
MEANLKKNGFEAQISGNRENMEANLKKDGFEAQVSGYRENMESDLRKQRNRENRCKEARI